MLKPWLMGIDLGGSGVRCLLVDSTTGASVGTSSPWQFTPAQGTFGTGFDLDLEQTWQAVGHACRAALAKAGAGKDQVAALAISAMRFSTVVTAQDGEVLLATPNTDARAAGECFDIAGRFKDSLLQTTGSPALPLHASARLAWLKNQDADSLRNAATVYGLGEWLTQRLCGERAIDPTQASASGLFRIDAREWDWELIDEFGFPREIFPPVKEPGTALGTLSPQATEHLGLSPDVIVAMGGGDTQLSLLGSNILGAGQCAIAAGTTAPVMAVTEKALLDNSGAMIAAHHVIPGRWVLESNGGPMGSALGTLAKILFPDAPDPELRLVAEAELSEPGAAGVLSTFGADLLDMAAPSMPIGHFALSHMSLADDPAPRRHLARAAVEGCACALRANMERLQSVLEAQAHGFDATTVALSGGLSRSDLFNQLLADISAREVRTPANWQTTALGAAACAGVAANLFSDFNTACKTLCADRAKFSPSSDNAAANDQLNTTWQSFRKQAQEATAPVAMDHVLPRVLREPDQAPATNDALPRPAALVTAAFDEDSLQRLRAHMDVEYASFRENHRLLTGPSMVEALAGQQVFVTEVDVLDAEALKQLPDLRVVAACRGDAVNVDVEACTAFGIPVMFAPGRNALAVADITVGFMISLARKLPAATQFLRQEDVTAGNMGKMGQAFGQLQGAELWRKTIGLVGGGAVGRAVAQRLAGFEAQILVYDPFLRAEQAALAGCRLVDLETLLAKSDFVSLHAAVTPETTGMIGAQEFAKMKPGAFFINTARGALIDEQSLVDALRSEHLGGAALDAFAVEPPGFDNPLVQHPNVISTPHSAGNTTEVAAHQGDSISRGLLQLLRGEKPGNVLNPETLDDFRWDGPRREPDEKELARLAEKSGPAVSDLQRDTREPQARDAGERSSRATAPAEIVEKMREILQGFCAGLASDPDVIAFSVDNDITLHFNAYDLGLDFYFHLNNGEVSSGLGPPAQVAEVQLEMRGEILDGMLSNSIDTMESAMNGEISFMGDAAKAMTLQHMNDDMARLYTAVREKVGDPGDLASIQRPGSAVAATPAEVEKGDIREDLVTIMQELYDAQVITATGGNISVRIPDTADEVWITPSRLFKGDLRPEVMVRINMQGESLDTGARSPSSEWCMHTRILEVKPQATAVIHAHAPNATILANSGLPFLPISTEAAFFGNIPRIPFTMPGTPELAELVGKAMEDEWAALLVNHGIIVAGRTLRRAADMVEIIERSAEVMLGCYAVGKEPPVLPPEDAAHFRKLGDIVA